MIYQIIKETKYKGCPIYIRRLDKHFEFLIIYKNKIYSDYITVVPKWYQVLMADPFSKEEVQNIAAILISKAWDLINKLYLKKAEEKAKKQAQALKKALGD